MTAKHPGFQPLNRSLTVVCALVGTWQGCSGSSGQGGGSPGVDDASAVTSTGGVVIPGDPLGAGGASGTEDGGGGSVPACGLPGFPCCDGNACSDGGCCVQGICMAQGVLCAGLGNQVCGAGVCGTCGGLGYPCCSAGSVAPFCTAPGATCLGAICGRCGGLGEACCAGGTCAVGCCSAGLCLASSGGCSVAAPDASVSPDGAAAITGGASGPGGASGRGGAGGSVAGNGGTGTARGGAGGGGVGGSGGVGGKGGSPSTGGATSTGGTAARASSPAVSFHGALRVANGRVVNSRGESLQLRGMSLFWSQWMGQYWNRAVIDWLVSDWKVTIVRAPLGVETAANDAEHPAYLDAPDANLALLRAVVDAAIADGIYVIIDWHDHNAPLHPDAAKSFFASMAQLYGAYPNVIYEIFNEPLPTYDWATIKAYASSVVASIRQYDPDNLIVVPTPKWDQDVDVAAADPVAGSNLAYTIHFYAGEPSHQASLRAKVQTALALGLPLFATEWGVTDAQGLGNVNLTESGTWLDLLRAYGISWCNWSIADKDEASSALIPGTAASGGWTAAQLTPSGTYLRGKLVAGAASEPWNGQPDAGIPPDAANPPSTVVTIASGRAQGAMTGWGWVDLGVDDLVTDPVCLDPEGPIEAGLSCLETYWSSSNAYCVSGYIPALSSDPTPDEYTNNWGIRINVGATADAAGTLGQPFSQVALSVTGTPQTGLRLTVHRRGDPGGTVYCAPITPGSLVSFSRLNTACWDDSGVSLSAADVANLDRVSLHVPSGTSSITLSNLCLTGLTFK
jgi:endoglucanase